MANYSDNQVVFFSENKEAVYDLWQKINDYINNSKTNSICGFLESLGYSEYESRNMSDLRNCFVGCDDEVTDDESVSFFYIKTETAWTGNIEVFYRVIEDHYNNEIEFSDKRVFMLSGGEKKRLEIFANMLSETDLLIIDEPSTFMDDYSRTTIANMLLDYPGAVILVSHDKVLLRKLNFKTYDIRDKRFREKETDKKN